MLWKVWTELKARWWHKVEIPYSFELFFSRMECILSYFSQFLFLVSRIYSRGSRYFFGCHIRRIWRWGDFNFADFFVLDFRDYNRNKIWMSRCLVKSMEFDLRGVIHFCRSNVVGLRLLFLAWRRGTWLAIMWVRVVRDSVRSCWCMRYIGYILGKYIL